MNQLNGKLRLMMSEAAIDVLPSGAVVLGPSITADGFERTRAFRIQTHLHADHMRGFSSSLRRNVILAPELRDLLRKKYPQIMCRSEETGIHTPTCDVPYVITDPVTELDFKVRQQYAGHMLGATQCSAELPDGLRVGYSGDFSWPLDRIIQVNQLVVDATYGDPASDRGFSQDEAEERFVELVTEKVNAGKGVEVIARPGVAERALMIVSMHELDRAGDVAVIADDVIRHYASVYREYKLPMVSEIIENGTEAQRNAVEHGRYIRFWGSTGGGALLSAQGFRIKLEMTFRGHEEVSKSATTGITTIGISNHANHNQTLEYIEKSGSDIVVTDACRAGFTKAKILADVVKSELGVRSFPRGATGQ